MFNLQRMQELVDKLQNKVRSYKKQIEEAEEIAALNLAKFRQVQGNLTGAQERADVNEQALAKAKARSRASSLAPVSIIIIDYYQNKYLFFLDVNRTDCGQRF